MRRGASSRVGGYVHDRAVVSRLLDRGRSSTVSVEGARSRSPAIVAPRMGSTRPPGDDAAIDAIAEEARGHASKSALGALALNVLSRQAEARVLFAGREFVDKRATEHGVSHESAATRAGNLRSILERGAETESERALVAAFAIVGLDERFERAADDERRTMVDRFARQVDWLEAATSYAVWALIDRAASPALARLFWAEVAQSIVDDAGERGRLAAIRGRNAARIAALAAARGEGAASALDELKASRLDDVTRGLLVAIAGGEAKSSGGARVAGTMRTPRSRGFLRVVVLFTGWAFVTWAVRGVGRLAGVRREAELALAGADLEVKERGFAFGRQVRERRDRVALGSVLAAGREVRYPSMHLYVGAIAFAVGVLVGGTWIFEGARSGELVLLSIGAGLLLGGALLDLVLDILVPATRGRVSIELQLLRGRTVRIDDIALEDADRFLDALRAAR
jgi:hypothetical protein